jgi:hypothetical protein
MRKKYRPGDWYAICAICGFRYFASELRKNYRGAYVCDKDFELKHPQESIRLKTDKITVPWAQPEVVEPYVAVTTYGVYDSIPDNPLAPGVPPGAPPAGWGAEEQRRAVLGVPTVGELSEEQRRTIAGGPGPV